MAVWQAGWPSVKTITSSQELEPPSASQEASRKAPNSPNTLFVFVDVFVNSSGQAFSKTSNDCDTLATWAVVLEIAGPSFSSLASLASY